MKQITIRGVPENLSRALQKERKRRGTSLNQTTLDLLVQALGIGSSRYDNGLSKFSGTWSQEELAAFEKQIEVFEQIDSELWK